MSKWRVLGDIAVPNNTGYVPLGNIVWLRPPLVHVECDEPSDEMIAHIKSIVGQNHKADEAI